MDVAYYIEGFLRQPNAARARSYLGITGGGGGGVAISAGANSVSDGTVVFSNANNVTFGMAGSTVTAIAGAGGGIVISAGANSQSTGTISFSNANGLSFGLDGAGVLTASHNGLTSQSNQAFSAQGGSSAFQTLFFNNANGATFSNNAGSVELSYTVPSTAGLISAVNFSAGAASADLTAVTFNNGNGVSFGLAAGVITASVQTNYLTTAMASDAGSRFVNTSAGLNLTNISATFNSNSISLSVAAAAGQSTQPVAASASNGSFLFSTLGFSNANNVTFGTSAGSIITASVSAAVADVTVSAYSPPWAWSQMATNSSLQQNTLYFQPFDLDCHLYASRINFYVSLSGSINAVNNTGTCHVCAAYALYTRDMTGANSDRISLLTSYSMSIAVQSHSSNTIYAATHYNGLANASSHSTSQVGITNANATTYQATSVNGLRPVAFPMFSSIMTPGRYYLGFSVSTVTGNGMTNNVSVCFTSVPLQVAMAPWGGASIATNAATYKRMFGWGQYGSTSNAWPQSIAITNADISQNAGAGQIIHFDIFGYATSTNIV